MADYDVRMELVDDKVQLSGVSAANAGQPLRCDFSPPLGAGQGFAGLELLTFSFAGCVSTTVLMLLRRAGVQVTGFRSHAEGFRREKPLSLERIAFRVELESNATAEAVEQALARARAISPVWLSLHPSIEVETGYQMNAAPCGRNEQ